MLQTNALSCVCSLWCIVDDVLETVFVFIMQLCYMCISVKCQPVNRMMLKIIQINSFLFLFIRPSAISWMTVNGATCCYLNPVFLAHAAL